jgi:hypothetical protein
LHLDAKGLNQIDEPLAKLLKSEVNDGHGHGDKNYGGQDWRIKKEPSRGHSPVAEVAGLHSDNDNGGNLLAPIGRSRPAVDLCGTATGIETACFDLGDPVVQGHGPDPACRKIATVLVAKRPRRTAAAVTVAKTHSHDWRITKEPLMTRIMVAVSQKTSSGRAWQHRNHESRR